jgi:hypothetical protein
MLYILQYLVLINPGELLREISELIELEIKPSLFNSKIYASQWKPTNILSGGMELEW